MKDILIFYFIVILFHSNKLGLWQLEKYLITIRRQKIPSLLIFVHCAILLIIPIANRHIFISHYIQALRSWWIIKHSIPKFYAILFPSYFGRSNNPFTVISAFRCKQIDSSSKKYEIWTIALAKNCSIILQFIIY